MRKNKKWLILSLTLVLAFTLMACGSDNETVNVNEAVNVEDVAEENAADTEVVTEAEEVVEETAVDTADTEMAPPEDGETPPDGLDENGDPVGPNDIEIYTWDSIPIEVERYEPVEFTNPDGSTHTYEVVYYAEKGINWVQAKALAEEAGGHLVTITSEEENDFVFSLVEDEKFWFQWDETHNYVMSGIFLGAYQPIDSEEPLGDWTWVTGEPFDYANWAVDGVEEDEDERPSDQPNDVNGNQNVICFGELNAPVSYWGDFPYKFGSLNDENDGQAYGFVIEYE